MFVHKTKYLRLDAMQVWWPPSVQDVRPILDQAPVLMLWQCPERLVRDFHPWVFRTRPFHTPLINLTRSEDELWQSLEPKSCRYEIRKAQKLDLVVSLNDDREAARLLINDSIRRLRYRDQMDETQWQALLPDHDIFLCRWQGTPVAAHVLLRDFPGRARLLLSGCEDRTNERFRGIVGPANRLLHWHELQNYKARAFHFYDFGGCVAPEASAPSSISQFKMSFGGEIIAEPNLYLAKNPGLRTALKGMGAARSALRRIPWPEAWLQALRTRPKLGALFR